MDTLKYIITKYNLSLSRNYPIEIPNVGRADLARLFAELDFKTGAEIGVERGLYTEVLCKSNPQAKIYAIDCWQAYPDYRDYVDQEQIDGFYEATKKRVEPYGNCQIIKGFSQDIARTFDDVLDFVYIDANHELPFVIHDLIDWNKLVKPGGIISGHDYYKPGNPGKPGHVIEALHAYTKAYNVQPWFVLGTKQKRPGSKRDWSRSWFWVRT